MQYLKQKHVKARYGGISDMTIWRWVRDGLLPQPVKFNGQNHWTDEQLQEADARLSGKELEAA